MCTGVEWAVIGAIASAASATVGSIAGYQQQQYQQQEAYYQQQRVYQEQQVAYQYDTQVRNYQYQAEVQAQQVAQRNEQAQIDYQYQVANQQYAYQNQLLDQDYQIQMEAYAANQKTYRDQLDLNQKAANRAYQAEQLKLASERKQAAVNAQELFVQKMQAQGQILATGRAGQGIGLLVSDAERVYGRDLAMLGTNLGYATDETMMGLESIFMDQQSADLRAASARMLEPSKPIKGPAPVKMPMSVYAPVPKPVMPLAPTAPTKPSAIGAGPLVAGIGGAVLGGVGTYAGSKPPGAKVG
jgi:hypothetical protein